MPFRPSDVLGASDPAFPARAMILESPPARQHPLREGPGHDPFPVEPDSPALQVLRWAQSEFPALHPGGVTDSAPLMSAPEVRLREES